MPKDINDAPPDVQAKALGVSLAVLCKYMALPKWPLTGTFDDKKHFIKHKQKRQPRNKISMMPMKVRLIVIRGLLDGKCARVVCDELAENGYDQKLNHYSFTAYRRTDEYQNAKTRRIDMELSMVEDIAVADLVSDPRQAMAMNAVLLYKLQQRIMDACAEEARDITRRLLALVQVRRVYLAEKEAAFKMKVGELESRLNSLLNSTDTIDGLAVSEIIDKALGVIERQHDNDDRETPTGGVDDPVEDTTVLAVPDRLDP